MVYLAFAADHIPFIIVLAVCNTCSTSEASFHMNTLDSFAYFCSGYCLPFLGITCNLVEFHITLRFAHPIRQSNLIKNVHTYKHNP